MADPFDILDDYDKQQLERELSKVRNRILLNKKKKLADASEPISYRDESGFSKRKPSEVMGKVGGSAAVDDGKGGYKRASVEEAVLNKLPAFDFTKLRQDYGDAGSRARGEIDPLVADKLNTVNLVDGEWYNLDDKGESYHIDDGEKGAMELMRKGAKPGLGVMSARRIALQRAKENAPEIDWKEEFPMPTLGPGKTRQFAFRVVKDTEDEEEPKEKEVLTMRQK